MTVPAHRVSTPSLDLSLFIPFCLPPSDNHRQPHSTPPLSLPLSIEPDAQRAQSSGPRPSGTVSVEVSHYLLPLELAFLGGIDPLFGAQGPPRSSPAVQTEATHSTHRTGAHASIGTASGMQAVAEQLVEIDEVEYLLGQSVLHSLQLVERLAILQQQHAASVCQLVMQSSSIGLYDSFTVQEALHCAIDSKDRMSRAGSSSALPPHTTTGSQEHNISETEVRKLGKDFSLQPSRLDDVVERIWTSPLPVFPSATVVG